MTELQLVDVSPLCLRETDGHPLRVPPRPRQLQDSDYLEKFDSSTLAYDVFAHGNRLCLVGPPLLNLVDELRDVAWYADGQQISINSTDLDRCSESWGGTGKMRELSLGLEGGGVFALVGDSHLDLMSGRRVLFTKSKNNRLEWIHDWARFYVEEHGVDAVLLYDNGSTDYAPGDVLEALNVPGLAVGAVVSWPFKWGPPGGVWGGHGKRPWDSDFCQYGIATHARRRFLEEADIVINQDVDELLLCEDGRNIADVLAASRGGFVHYYGRWIEGVTPTRDGVKSFGDYAFFDPSVAPTTRKWSAVAERIRDSTQWKVHSVVGAQSSGEEGLLHRHFRAITTNWKWNRTAQGDSRQRALSLDRRLVQAVQSAGLGSRVGGQSESGASGSRALEILRLVDESRWAGEGLSEVLVGDEGVTLVFVGATGNRFRIEASWAEGGLSVLLKGEDDSSWHAARRRLGGWARGLSGQSGVFVLASWTRNELVDPIPVSMEMVQVVERAVSLLQVHESPVARSVPTYSWNLRGNFEDLIGEWVVEQALGRPVHNTIGEASGGPALMPGGSTIQGMQRKGMTVWGSGLIAPLSESVVRKLTARAPDRLLAVRGELTWRELSSRLGWRVPRLFGDPALLLPRFVPRASASGCVALVPHYTHGGLFSKSELGSSVVRVAPGLGPEAAVEAISGARAVIATSLYGIMVAQAYHVPWLWLKVVDSRYQGDDFTFEDFSSLLNRAEVRVVEMAAQDVSGVDWDSLAEGCVLPASRFDAEAFLEALLSSGFADGGLKGWGGGVFSGH